MQEVKNDSKSTFGVTSDEVIALFEEKKNMAAFTKAILYLVGIILTPITLAGSLWFYIRSYTRFASPGQHPNLGNLKPIDRVAMVMGGILIWIVLYFSALTFFNLYSFIFQTGSRDRITPTIMFVLNLGLSIAVFVAFKRWQKNTSAHIQEQSRFGTARWADPTELVDLIANTGLYIGGGIYNYSKQGHLLTMAGTRGGKLTNLIAANLLGKGGYKGSWFVIDVKGELTAITARQQRAKGQRVVILDPWNINTENPDTYNILDLVANQKNPDHLIDDISVISEMIVPKQSKGDDFWTSRARSVISGILLHLILTGDENMKTLSTLWSWLRLPEEEWNALLVEMAVSDNKIVRNCANEILGMVQTSEKMWGSILSTIHDKTDFLKSPALQKSLASSNFDIRDLTDGATTIFVIIPPDKLDSHYQWLRLVTTTAMRSVIRNRNKRVTFLLDEFAALGYLPESIIALSTYAGYSLTLWPIIQDLSQLKTIYGESWEQFITNTAVRHFFSASGNFTLDYLSVLMGTTSTVTYDDGKANTTSRSLATADEIRRASAENIFTIIEQRPPTFFPKLPYYKMPELDGLHDPNPYYKPDGK